MRQNLMEEYQIAFKHMAEGDKERMLKYISDRFSPRKAFNYKHSAYGLKHELQDRYGMYVSWAQFTGAMLTAGYKAEHSESGENAYFNISLKEFNKQK